MSTKTNSTKKFSIPEIIGLLHTSAEKAWDELIASRYYINNKAPKFWAAFEKEDITGLMNLYPENLIYYPRIAALQRFYILDRLYQKEIERVTGEIVKRNPKLKVLVEACYIVLDLGSTHIEPDNLVGYSLESLEALKISLCRIVPKLSSENQSDFTLALFDDVRLLIRLETDNCLLKSFLDIYIYADFFLKKIQDGPGFNLEVFSDEYKSKNIYIKELIKTEFKRSYKRGEAQGEISQQPTFKKLDPIYKSDLGLAPIIVSKGITVTSSTPGITFLEDTEGILDKITSENLEEQAKAQAQLLKTIIEQNFLVNFRRAHSEVWQPADVIDIHALHIYVGDTYVSLFDIFCVSSCLIAFADNLRYVDEISQGNIAALKNLLLWQVRSKNPPLSEQQINEGCDKYIVDHLSDIEKSSNYHLFHYFGLTEFINLLKRTEELKGKTDKDLESIINLFASIDSSLPFSFLYRVDDKYYFSYKTCNLANLNRMIYDAIITQKLFNNRDKSGSEKDIANSEHGNRETMFNTAIEKLFKTLTPKVRSSLKFSDPKNNYDFGELEGDFDAIAYFEKENLLIPVQVKLSNTTKSSERKKYQWVRDNIENMELKDVALRQVEKDLILLTNPSGLKFVSEKLGLDKVINSVGLTIVPLIITDNFYVDHQEYTFSEKYKPVIVISFFELEHLITNVRIDDRQSAWDSLTVGKSGNELIRLIKENVFWGFIDNLTPGYTLKKSIKAVDDESKIHLRI